MAHQLPPRGPATVPARFLPQTFCDIVEAQRLMVPGSDATFLRHLHAARPEWWSDAPGYIANAS